MYKLLEGQIAFAGMQYALESVSRLNSIKNGILRITSNEGSGIIGIFCGRFITGAAMTLSGDTGHRALRQLLTVKEGSYAFLDAGDEVFDELKQNLGVDVEQLLAMGLKAGVPLTDETLTGLTVSGDEIKAFDTTFDVSGLDENERLVRIQRTYDKLLALSRRPTPTPTATAETAQPSADPDSSRYESPDAGAFREDDFSRRDYDRRQDVESGLHSEPRELPRDVVHERTALPPWDQPWEPKIENQFPEAAPREFKRIKNWSEKGSAIKNGITALIVIIGGGIVWAFWDKILAFLHVKAH